MMAEQLTIKAFHNQIARLSDFVLHSARTSGFSEKTSYACSLATAEACENIITHGYGGETDLPISLTVSYTPEGSLIINLSDEASPFNASIRPEEIPLNTADPPVGGLGLLIIHRVMDDITYHRKGNSNNLTLIKKR